MAKAKAKARARAGRKTPVKAKAKATPKKKTAKAKAKATTRTKEPKRAAGRKASPPPRRRRSPRGRVQAPRVSPKELQRRLAAARAGAASLERQWFRAFERMRVHLGDPIGRELVLRVAKAPPAAKGTPWVQVARFSSWDRQASYTELHLGLRAIERDAQIESEINRQRICRIAVLYDGVAERGGRKRVEREFVLAERAPWEVCISRAVERTDPGLEDSLVARYDHDETHTLIRAVFVWVSAETATDVEF